PSTGELGPGGRNDATVKRPASRTNGAKPRAGHGWFILVAIVALHGTHPVTWGRPEGMLWFAHLGIGIALVAWLGSVGALLVAAGGLLVGIQAWIAGAAGPAGGGGLLAMQTAVDAGLTALEAWAAWALYSRVLRGGSLNDPRSAVLFLVLVPGGVVGIAALG